MGAVCVVGVEMVNKVYATDMISWKMLAEVYSFPFTANTLHMCYIQYVCAACVVTSCRN